MASTHLWLRAESKPNEERTALTPSNARALLEAGFRITVEDCSQRAFAINEYKDCGCELAPAHSWQFSAPADAFIFGLKELDPRDSSPLTHRHIHFAHVYKGQHGWAETLRRFDAGGGVLYDLEYLCDENGRRIAAFGHWAGFAGAAVALMAWAGQRTGRSPVLDRLCSHPNRESLVSNVVGGLNPLQQTPKVMVIGALGRGGRGAVELCETVRVPVIAWDLEETKRGGPFPEAVSADILVNCVFVQSKVPPFVTMQLLEAESRRLSVICDVSCDPYGDYNPLPIYDACTTFDAPTRRLISGDCPLDLIAIDHLPSLLPAESSEDFCTQLLPHLIQLTNPEQGVWQRARKLFDEKVAAMRDL